jgi:hypothetical protein
VASRDFEILMPRLPETSKDAGSFRTIMGCDMVDYSRILIYRRNAKQCIEMAERATRPSDRDEFVAIADEWHELADDLEQTHGYLPEPRR